MPFIDAVSRWYSACASDDRSRGNVWPPPPARRADATNNPTAMVNVSKTKMPSRIRPPGPTSPRPRMVRYQVVIGQGRAEGEVPEPIDSVGLGDRKQLIDAGERGDDDGENIILNQDDRHDQAQRRAEVPHRGRVEPPPSLKMPSEYMYSSAEDDVGDGDHRHGDVPVLLQAVRMQRPHHLAGGVEVRGEVIHAEKRHRRQQPDLAGAMHLRILLPLAGAARQAMDDNTMSRPMERSIDELRPSAPCCGPRVRLERLMEQLSSSIRCRAVDGSRRVSCATLADSSRRGAHDERRNEHDPAGGNDLEIPARIARSGRRSTANSGSGPD